MPGWIAESVRSRTTPLNLTNLGGVAAVFTIFVVDILGIKIGNSGRSIRPTCKL